MTRVLSEPYFSDFGGLLYPYFERKIINTLRERYTPAMRTITFQIVYWGQQLDRMEVIKRQIRL